MVPESFCFITSKMKGENTYGRLFCMLRFMVETLNRLAVGSELEPTGEVEDEGEAKGKAFGSVIVDRLAVGCELEPAGEVEDEGEAKGKASGSR